MSDDLKKLQEAMTAVQGHLQDLQAEQNATTRELKNLESQTRTALKSLETSVKNLGDGTAAGFKTLTARSVQIEASLAALGGTFASIDQILGKALGDHERVVGLEAKYTDLQVRVEALEKKAS